MTAVEKRKIQQTKNRLKKAERELVAAARELAKVDNQGVLGTVMNTCQRIRGKLTKIADDASDREVYLNDKRLGLVE